MRKLETTLDGPILLAPSVHRDERGFFLETFRQSDLSDLGIEDEWVQDNHSRSVRGVVRGIHFQPGMAKLVRCSRGAIFDVIVDLRVGSPTFGHWEGHQLDDHNHHQFLCPDGFGHGFCVLSEVADVVYKTSSYYDASQEAGFTYADPDVGIEWPEGMSLRSSARDAAAPRLAELADQLPYRFAS